MLAFEGWTALLMVGAVTLAGFAIAAWRALTAQERRDVAILLRRPGRIRAVLKGEPA
jgi:hypothetical protein